MKIIKSIFFYPMMWLRKPFLLLGKLLGGLMFIVAILSFFIENFLKIVFMFAGFSFFFFLMNHFYDRILLWLNPEKTNLYLFQ